MELILVDGILNCIRILYGQYSYLEDKFDF